MNARLTELHKSMGAQMEEFGGFVLPSVYSSIENEYSMARRSAVFFDLSHFGRLRLKGKDSADLLNRLVTNDLRGMRPGMGKQAFFTTEKGRVIDLCTIYVMSESILVLTSPGNSENVKKWIEKFIVNEDVLVEDVTLSFPMFYIAGTYAANFVKEMAHSSYKSFLDVSRMPKSNFIRTFLGGIHVFLSRSDMIMKNGYLMTVDSSNAEEVWNNLNRAASKFGAAPAGISTFEILRVENGTPVYPYELNDNAFPPELNVFDAISFTKGCYVGQEVISRMQVHDKVRRRLVGFVSATKVPRGSKIFSANSLETEAGVVTSSVKSPGLNNHLSLAFVTVQKFLSGESFFANAGNKNIEMQISTLPFIV
ncbi:MAG: aminomethyltransferase family protein [Candidatus Kryptoniota bacterium]